MSDYYGNADALAQLESELGQVFYISGSSVPYPCIVGDRKDMKDLGYGGYANGAAVEIVTRQALFTNPPSLKSVITLNDRALLINEITNSPDGSCYVLSCDDMNKDS